MKPLYTNDDFSNAKANDKLPCECYQCGDTFLKEKKYIKYELDFSNGWCMFCSKKCRGQFNKKEQKVNCLNCQSTFIKGNNQLIKTKNNFCSRSCSATYNNKNKNHGTRRSKLEIWLEEQLTMLYPNLPIDFNKKDTIGSELDIYIPSLNLAFELNGIFHYEPIYGVNKLNQIQENDISKSKTCHDLKIDLCIIDTSQQKYFKPESSKKYLKIILKIINKRLLTS
jgi:hypothetical protein